MVEIALMVGFTCAVAFLVYLGWRFGKSYSDDASVGFLIAEFTCYGFAGLLVTTMLFLLMEIAIAAGASYSGVVRSIFIIFQVLLGLVSSLGAIGGAISLIVVVFKRIFGGARFE